jgi:ABC-2 type transport system ATP-binding protein
MTDLAIRIRGLRKQYRAFTLKDVDLDVPRGYVTGLIGPNGAGKTTIIKLIMNLVHRDAGTISVLGLDNLADEAAVKSRVGFIYDEPPFYHDVSLARSARAVAAFYPGWSDRRFADMAARFGLPLGKRFKALSHGMKMKFALAVALSHDADLLLMDEPTAGLDLAFRRELLDELGAILQDEHKSVLFSTHITTDLERIADYVTLIRDGAIAFTLPTRIARALGHRRGRPAGGRPASGLNRQGAPRAPLRCRSARRRQGGGQGRARPGRGDRSRQFRRGHGVHEPRGRAC